MSTALEQLLQETQPTGNLTLILALAWVINYDYAVYNVWSLTIGTYATDRRKSFYHEDLIEAILKRTSLGNIKFMLEDISASRPGGFLDYNEFINNNNEEYISSIYVSKNIAIWFIDGLEAFGLLEADLLNSQKLYNRDGFFCIVYTGTEAHRFDTVKIIFNRLLNIYLVNINVFIMYGNVPYLYTYYPFSQFKCHQSQPEYHLSFHGIKEGVNYEVKKRLFPNKLINMHGCVLHLTTWPYAPCIYLDRDNKTGEVTRFHGVEGNLFSLLAEIMNFRLQINVPKPGDIEYRMGAVTNAVQGLINGTSNITVVCLKYDQRRADVVQASLSYLSQFVVLAIPKGKTMSPFERLAKPFKYIIWSCFSSSILLAIIFIFTIKCMRRKYLSTFIFGKGNDTPFTNLWLILFGGNIHHNAPKRNFSRYLLAIWLLYTMVLRAAYTGELYIILQDSRARMTLQSLQELVEKNYTIYSPAVFAEILRETLKSTNIRAMHTSQATLNKLIEGLHQANAKYAVTTFASVVRTYNKENLNQNRYIKAVPEVVITMPVTFYMRKHSFLKYRFNSLLINIMSAGLIKKFESFYMDGTMNDVRTRQVPSKLSLWLLFGLFSIYFVLLGLSAFIFLLEVLSKKSRTLEKLIDFLNY